MVCDGVGDPMEEEEEKEEEILINWPVCKKTTS